MFDEQKPTFGKWNVSSEDTKELNPQKVRDLMIECFYTSQKGTLSRVKKKLGMDASDHKVKESVIQIVKLCFREMQTDFENPTKKDLVFLAERLSRHAAAWGTPREILQHHQNQFQILLDQLT